MRLNKDIVVERLNNLLYDSRPQALRIANLTTLICAILGISLLLYNYGFELELQQSAYIQLGIHIILWIFLFSFLLRWLYAFRRIEFIKETPVESSIMALLLIRQISKLFGSTEIHLYQWIGFIRNADFYHYFTAFLLVLLLLLELSKASTRLSSIKIRPDAAFVLSFVLLILLGSGLLMLPAMTTQPGNMTFVDALFTSVSATCVTGLIVVDTATFFTMRGQIVILILIQLGGLGILSFATFFASFLSHGLGFRQKMLIPDYLDTETISSSGSLLRQIVFITFSIELGTAILLFFTWSIPFDSLGEKVFFSVFHAISAFCNAGFSIFTNGLYEEVVRNNYILHMIVAISLILGSIGFAPIKDVFSPRRLRDRLQHPWKDWALSTKIAINVSIILLLVGTALFFWIERDNTLAGMNLTEALITSFFQSATTRTAGFNTVDFSQLAYPTLIFMMMLMFIGGSSASTAGGIKTSTFYLILVSVFAISRGQSRIYIGNRYIPTDILYKSLSIFFYGVAINVIMVFLLSITEAGTDMMALIFEQVSAFGTVGLSTGITATLSTTGKALIVISMFLGRVGTLTFAVALSTRISTANYKLPAANIMVG
ncbi:TrkH family potassium uptake protein [Catalinimonas niigatensis]|uniref:TrkH family potassium uptake protein n=1 Tax=Catalinimonas niigatensis TaxID=1397264 RepID=UPI0026668868|nr:potassium transporter TrkG [Catalinimonas niigatensis]WPP47956.1 potassium transporter TrkG [Catalinimonas niigatensis]